MQLSDSLHFGIHPAVVKPKIKIDHYIDLTEKMERKKDALSSPRLERHQTYKNFPIKDRCATSLEELQAIAGYILDLEGVVYIYCKGGHGRSGLVAAAVHGYRNGMNGSEALQEVNREWHAQRDLTKLRPNVRQLGSPQTRKQKGIVKEYLDQRRRRRTKTKATKRQLE